MNVRRRKRKQEGKIELSIAAQENKERKKYIDERNMLLLIHRVHNIFIIPKP